MLVRPSRHYEKTGNSQGGLGFGTLRILAIYRTRLFTRSLGCSPPLTTFVQACHAHHCPLKFLLCRRALLTSMPRLDQPVLLASLHAGVLCSLARKEESSCLLHSLHGCPLYLLTRFMQACRAHEQAKAAGQQQDNGAQPAFSDLHQLQQEAQQACSLIR